MEAQSKWEENKLDLHPQQNLDLLALVKVLGKIRNQKRNGIGQFFLMSMNKIKSSLQLLERLLPKQRNLIKNKASFFLTTKVLLLFSIHKSEICHLTQKYQLL
jgi:hypothetical protein